MMIACGVLSLSKTRPCFANMKRRLWPHHHSLSCKTQYHAWHIACATCFETLYLKSVNTSVLVLERCVAVRILQRPHASRHRASSATPHSQRFCTCNENNGCPAARRAAGAMSLCQPNAAPTFNFSASTCNQVGYYQACGAESRPPWPRGRLLVPVALCDPALGGAGLCLLSVAVRPVLAF